MHSPTPEIDLTDCDREPIHQLGFVQPFGFLVAFGGDWLVTRASANLVDFLGREAEEVLGGAATDLFCAEAIHVIRNMAAVLRGPDAVERGFDVALTEGGPPYDLAIHFSGPNLVVEAEPAAPDRADASALVRGMMSRVRQTPTLRDFLHEACRQVRALTGFDRAMVYRFDKTGSGEVMAEARRTGVDSYLGLNFPASDIPIQARALYVRNIFRVIADVEATPSPITPQLDPEGAPLDLSLSVLRAVSPVHIEYLRNMGVAASLSISIVVEGRLWGLFACHNLTPRRPSFVERTAAELFGAMFSLMLESRERTAEAEYERKARAVADRLLATIAQDAGQMADAEWFGGVVGEAIPSEGVGVLIDGIVSLSGLTPDRAEFLALLAVLNRRASNQIYATDHLADLLPAASAYAARAAGMLVIPISRSPRDYVVLFRPELLRAIRWAGDPQKPAQADGGRLSPRTSFQEWSQMVRGRAAPFTPAELRIAETLRGALLEVVLRLAEAAGQERQRADERQTLLIAELNHRVRNILALIRGLVSQTRQGPGDGQDMMLTLDLRVQALARAHDQVTADRMAPASLTGLILTEASAFLGARRDRVRVLGQDVRLAPEAFTVMALVIHEMVTNAAKYGALSDSGWVEIDWRRDTAGDLILTWRELGGPVVAAPARRGFGSTIIERSVPHELGGRAELRYALGGLEAEFTVPERFLAAGEPADLMPPAAGLDTPPVEATPLRDLVVLLVEDSLMIALECEASLLTLGAREVLVAGSVAEAHALLATREVDLGVLDFNLGKETSVSVADILIAQGKPVVFATGYGEALNLGPQHQAARVITKPYTLKDLIPVLEGLSPGDADDGA
ncbi:HWE histidine kinase domain-containing protein [Phenylobacterium aquaticum]|uniref:HWE histidine kinase domain-containing protein n=1 Tax=Phenylobacterium aquaticum TaxID=1763816 RepID=UPI001F5C34E5|nr:HWE histidine kinase domain-containing protein [Phenylobacterium aquaticum]MCI3135020.1 GAF domain-containing protein [Phenylobacterium aquaticum]